jgi:hypothetical protein
MKMELPVKPQTGTIFLSKKYSAGQKSGVTVFNLFVRLKSIQIKHVSGGFSIIRYLYLVPGRSIAKRTEVNTHKKTTIDEINRPLRSRFIIGCLQSIRKK